MNWLVVGLDSGVHWPTVETRVQYRGTEFILRPETDRFAPDVTMQYRGELQDALRVTRRFLSALAWVENGHLREMGVTGGTHPIHIGKGPMARMINPQFRVDYLPQPDDERAHLALALYREALNLNSPPFQFLSFYKVINILHGNGAAQTAWINRATLNIEDQVARQRLAEIQAQHEDVGGYLYASGRCAVAHAFDENVVDPDDPVDTIRLAKDLSVIKALAEYAIEVELGVQTQRTVWRQHLYELQGFRELLRPEVLAALREGREVATSALPAFPPLTLQLRDRPILRAFQAMRADVLEVSGGRLLLRCRSHDDRMTILLGLNFSAERLEFDPHHGVGMDDDGSSEVLRHSLDHIAMLRGLLANGQLEVWDADTDRLLGRTDPYIPVNIDLRATDEHLEAEERRIAAMLQERSADGESADSRAGDKPVIR